MDEVFTLQDEEIKNALPVKYNKNYQIIQANELVRSRQDDLTLLEAKLVRLAIAQILKDDTDLETYSCNTTRLAEFLGITRQAVYFSIQDLSLSLMKKRIFIKSKDKAKSGKPNYKIFHWVDYIEYKDGTITIKLSKSLKPYLVGLDKLFVSYRYEELLKLKTTYAIRLYELLVSYSNMRFTDELERFTYRQIPLEKNEFIFSMDYLREYFNCDTKYSNNVDFIKRVITAGVNDINKNTLLPCSYRLIKEGKKIAYIIFKVGDWKALEGQTVLENFMRNEAEQKQRRGRK